MKALVITEKGKVEITDKPVPTPQRDQALVKVLAAGLNKRDQFIREGKYPGIELGTTLGSDAVGIVESVADDTNEYWVRKEVIVNPNIGWGADLEVQSSDYTILGMPTDGTLAEYVVVGVDRLVEKPKHLLLEEAAVLPLGGLTAYRAAFHHGKIQPSSKVLISGFGGGVAQFAFQFSKATGADVFVTSGNDEKLERAIEAGAVGAVSYKEENWYKDLLKSSGGFNVIIDSSGGDQINTFIKLMRPAGRIVFFGATNGLPSNVDLYRMFWNQITLQGSTMGNDLEFSEMVSFVDQHKIHPIVDSMRPFTEVISAFDDLATNQKMGKLAIKL